MRVREDAEGAAAEPPSVPPPVTRLLPGAKEEMERVGVDEETSRGAAATKAVVSMIQG